MDINNRYINRLYGKIMKPSVILFALALFTLTTQAQDLPVADRIIEFPDVPGYLTLKCDFHLHTVFSDGSVWPNIRVQEAQRDGLDAIALTDHIEYQPHEDDIPHPDRNRSYDIALEAAEESDLIVLRGSEITRDMPPGHANAIFLKDANMLVMEDSVAVFYEANRQGAFTFWNHPHWTAQRDDGIATLTDLHRRLIREGLLNGIEVVNDGTYSDEAFQIAIDNNLTIMGTSDIHGLVDWRYNIPQGGHRPVTLVFAKERSAAGIQEALKAGRTTVWFENTLIGREEYLIPLIQSSLIVRGAAYQEDKTVLSVMIENVSDVAFLLDNHSVYTLHANTDIVTVAPHQTQRLMVKTLENKTSVVLPFGVLNAVMAPNTHPEISLNVSIR